MQTIRILGVIIGALLICTSPCYADAIFLVSLDTAPLIGHIAGPFSIEFQLNDGSGTSNGNNTAIISNFLFGSGGSATVPNIVGGASGSLSSIVTITDSDFFNEFFQEFVPGTTLSFDVHLTTNLSAAEDPLLGGTPDQFSFAILDKTGVEIPTFGSAGEFLSIDINSTNPSIHLFTSDPSISPAGGGSGISISPLTNIVAQPLPAPSTLFLLTSGCFCLLAYVAWNRTRAE